MRPASKYLFFEHLFQVPICLYLGFQVPRFRPANWPTTRCMTFLTSSQTPPHLGLKNTFEKRHPQRHGSARPLCEMWTDGQENPGFYVLVKQGKKNILHKPTSFYVIFDSSGRIALQLPGKSSCLQMTRQIQVSNDFLLCFGYLFNSPAVRLRVCPFHLQALMCFYIRQRVYS